MKLPRRQFLQTIAAAALLGHDSHNVLAKSGEKWMSDATSYDVAVIGAGVFGCLDSLFPAKIGSACRTD